MAKASAPAKVHLIGEHSVVYGTPAILAAVGMRCFIISKKNEDGKIRINNRGRFESENSLEEIMEITDRADKLWADCNEKGDFAELFAFLKEDDRKYSFVFTGKTLQMLGVQEGLDMEMWTDIPLGSGLGSSAAFGAATAKSVAEALGKQIDKEKVNEIAFALEKYCHGKPSGGDNSACTYGGVVWFQKNPEGGKPIIKPLEVPALENFVFVYAGRPEKSTGELVQLVEEIPEEKRNPIMKNIGEMVPQMLEAMKAKDYPKIRELINKTWDNLYALGLSTPNIDKIVEAVRGIGGAAKGCGAVGGGIVLCQHDNIGLLKSTIKKAGFEPMEADLAVEGVRLE